MFARFIDERHLPPDSVPQSYTTLYEFTTLDELQFQKAQELQLFRPDVQRYLLYKNSKGSSVNPL